VFSTLRNAWKITDLRKKILFTLFIVILYRIGNVIPVPFVDTELLATTFEQNLSNTILGLYNVMSGSAFSQATIFALSIQPYINASIIIQLLTIAIPPLERLSKDGGEEGKKKIEKITRYTTVGLGLLMGFAYYMMLRNTYTGILTENSVLSAVVIILTFTAGASLVMWLGEQITEFGIGNGISIILFANIISRLPSGIQTLATLAINDFANNWYVVLGVIIGVAAMVVLVVFITQSERRIPVQYAKRVVGRKVYGGQNTNLPIKVNMTGVLPIIFAQSICSLPATIATFCGMDQSNGWYKYVFTSTSAVYCVFYFLLIIGFSYFYATIQYNPVEIANNLKKNGGFIPGFRPGRPTSDFIAKVINKITLFGALYLAVVAILPIVAGALFGNTSLSIGGTSVIIVVGVALETVAAMEAQMLMRHYKGFLE
jgi:preprotein translocase subunit SecY